MNLNDIYKQARINSLSFLNPLIFHLQYSGQEEVAKKLGNIAQDLFNYMRSLNSDESDNAIQCIDFDAEFVFQHVDAFCKLRGFEEYNSENAKTDLNNIAALGKGVISAENYQSITKIRDIIKCSCLFTEYPVAEPCVACGRKWTELKTSYMSYVRQCWFCDNEEVLSYKNPPIYLTMDSIDSMESKK